MGGWWQRVEGRDKAGPGGVRPGARYSASGGCRAGEMSRKGEIMRNKRMRRKKPPVQTSFPTFPRDWWTSTLGSMHVFISELSWQHRWTFLSMYHFVQEETISCRLLLCNRLDWAIRQTNAGRPPSSLTTQLHLFQKVVHSLIAGRRSEVAQLDGDQCSWHSTQRWPGSIFFSLKYS